MYNCCFKLFGAKPAIPTISIGTNCRTVKRFQSRRYSILCEIRWNPACLAPCVTGKQGTNQAPLDNKPAIHLSESASTFPACPFTSIHTVNPTSVVESVTFSCSVLHLNVSPRHRGETVYQQDMKDPNLHTKMFCPFQPV